MTTPSAFMFGWLMIFTIALAWRLFPVVGDELRADDMRWRENKSLRISIGLYTAMAAGGCFGLSVIVAPPIYRNEPSQWLLWSAFALATAAEILVASGLGRIRVPLALSALWSIVIITLRFA